MKTITFYVADDGSKFTSKEECMHYESLSKEEINTDGITIYDEKGEVMNPSLKSDVRECYYVNLESEDAAKRFNEICGKMGALSPVRNGHLTTGIHYYDDEIQDWCSLEKVVDNINYIVKYVGYKISIEKINK